MQKISTILDRPRRAAAGSSEAAALATRRQWALNDPQMIEIARRFGVDEQAVVLDVGCDSGGFLDALAREFHPMRLVGLDVNRVAIASGQSLASHGVVLIEGDITKGQVSGGGYTHVFCLNALTYMHQRRALQHMAAAAAPGGIVVIACETIYFDFLWLFTRGPASALRALRDVAFGLVVNATGAQPKFSRWWGRRAFVSPRRLGQRLTDLGFEVELDEPRRKGRPFLGKPTQRVIVGRKRR